MQGNLSPPSARGIIPRSFEHIFEAISVVENKKFLVVASYLEIYNEDIRDLLGSDCKKKLDLKESPQTGIHVQGDYIRFPSLLVPLPPSFFLPRISKFK